MGGQGSRANRSSTPALKLCEERGEQGGAWDQVLDEDRLVGRVRAFVCSWQLSFTSCSESAPSGFASTSN
jgi:hypothetical protein